jgi:hypothetical protein
MANRIQITELDFDTIKTNLKNFLKSQNTFQDYDFEGSGLSILLDILAYNTHYNAFYLNMVANEAFLDSSLMRDSVVSHAKTLGYTPHSKRAPRAVINIEGTTTNPSLQTLTLERGTTFQSSVIDNQSYTFTLLEDITVTQSDLTFYFENVEIYQGTLVDYIYVHDEINNPKSIFTIPDSNIDTTTIKVIVQESLNNTNFEIYNLVNDVYNIDGESQIYFLQETRNEQYQIYFGDGVLGKKLKDGNVVKLQYLITSGADANGAEDFVASNSINDVLLFITNVSNSSGGFDRESIDNIKLIAPSQFVAQNRLVTTNDYNSYISKNYPNLDSVVVWGGEDEIPVVYGKIFISLKPKENYYISEAEKERIIEDIVKPRSMPTIKTEIRDPEYLYILTSNSVKYRKDRTALSREALAQKIRNTIIDNTSLNKFGSIFVTSKLEQKINDSEPNSIVGTQTSIRIQKRFTPVLNTSRNYTLNFNVPLLQGTFANKLTSTEFVIYDSNGNERTVFIEEVPKSFTGISDIAIVDPGYSYSSAPIVTITGDGTGATAVATIKFGRIQSITVTNPGVDYTRATVTITGGGGVGGSAVANIDAKYGTLRTAYYNSNSERIVVNKNIGTIDYENGLIMLNDLKIVNNSATDGFIRVNCGVRSDIIEAKRNTLLVVDENDPSAITINLEAVL